MRRGTVIPMVLAGDMKSYVQHMVAYRLIIRCQTKVAYLVGYLMTHECQNSITSDLTKG